MHIHDIDLSDAPGFLLLQEGITEARAREMIREFKPQSLESARFLGAFSEQHGLVSALRVTSSQRTRIGESLPARYSEPASLWWLYTPASTACPASVAEVLYATDHLASEALDGRRRYRDERPLVAHVPLKSSLDTPDSKLSDGIVEVLTTYHHFRPIPAAPQVPLLLFARLELC